MEQPAALALSCLAVAQPSIGALRSHVMCFFVFAAAATIEAEETKRDIRFEPQLQGPNKYESKDSNICYLF